MANCYGNSPSAENFARYLREIYLRIIPEVVSLRPRRAIGAIVLNCSPDMRDEAVLEQGLEQNMPYTCRFSPCRYIFVKVTRDEYNRRGDVAVAQTTSQFDAVHVRHFVIDHKAINAGRTDGFQQRVSVSERSNVEPVRFKKKSQRAEDVRVVVDYIDW